MRVKVLKCPRRKSRQLLIGGTYYLQLKRFDSGSFTFCIDVEYANETFSETTDRRDNLTTQANSILINRTYVGQIAYNDDVDYYRFTVSQATTIPLHIDSDSIWAIRYRIFDSSINEMQEERLWYNERSGLLTYSEDLSFSKAGVYYICFEKYSGHTGYYTFSLGSAPVLPTTNTVSFNANGGSVSPSRQEVSAGTSITLPTATRSGYTFLGWSESSSAATATYAPGSSYTVNKNVTLYAVWGAVPAYYTVSYNGNGGSVSPSCQEVSAGKSITLPSATRSGYTFLGWSESSNATAATYAPGASYTVTRDVTLYAVWQKTTDPKPNTNTLREAIIRNEQFMLNLLVAIINFILKLLGSFGIII